MGLKAIHDLLPQGIGDVEIKRCARCIGYGRDQEHVISLERYAGLERYLRSHWRETRLEDQKQHERPADTHGTSAPLEDDPLLTLEMIHLCAPSEGLRPRGNA